MVLLIISIMFFGCTKEKVTFNGQSFITSINQEKENIYNSSHTLRLKVLDNDKILSQVVYVYNIDKEMDSILKVKLEVYENEKDDVYYFEDDYFYFESDDKARLCKTKGSFDDIKNIMGTNPFDLILESNIDNYEQKTGVAFLKLTTNLKKHILSMNEDFTIIFLINNNRYVIHDLNIESYTYKESDKIDSYMVQGLDENNNKVVISYEKFHDNEVVNIPTI